jgi:hypothetical protein
VGHRPLGLAARDLVGAQAQRAASTGSWSRTWRPFRKRCTSWATICSAFLASSSRADRPSCTTDCRSSTS